MCTVGVEHGQLEGALQSRVAIEQAKGIVAEDNPVSVDDAFTLLRNYTRNHNRLLRQTATTSSTAPSPPTRSSSRPAPPDQPSA